MCSRETTHKTSSFDPTVSVLSSLHTANSTLVSSLQSGIAHLRSLLPTFYSPSCSPAAAEAICIEALAIIATARSRISQYNDLYAPLFTASEPLDVLRRASVVVVRNRAAEGDSTMAVTEGSARRSLQLMVRVVRGCEGEIELLERWFRRALGWVHGGGGLEGLGQEIDGDVDGDDDEVD